MARKYTGTSDGPAKAKRAGTEKLQQLLCKKYGAKSLGTYVVRNMRGSNNLSVHATGRAADIQGPNRRATLDIIEFLEANAQKLMIEEIHDYAHDPDGKGPGKAWGRGWRCSRKELGGKAGWKIWDAEDNGGSPGAAWCHWEISPKLADNAQAVTALWKEIHAGQVTGE
jgi:hypothetical protein